MDKLAVRVAEGHNPKNEDGSYFEDGVEVELTPHVDSLLRCGLLILDCADGESGPGENEVRPPETKEDFHALYKNMTNADLKAALASADVEVPDKAKKADLVELIMGSHFPEGE